METENMVDVTNMGFTAEDFEAAGVEMPTEQTKSPAEPEPKDPTEKEPTAGEAGEPTGEQGEPAGEPEEPATIDENKHGGDLNIALREERARRKAADAELKALKEQLQQSTQQTAPAQPPRNIREEAKQAAMKALAIKPEELDNLMFTDQAKYEDYISEKSRYEVLSSMEQDRRQQTFQKNVDFVQELNQIPNIGAVYQFALEELDGMTRKDAIPIDNAFERINAGTGTDNDFGIVREFAKACQEKMAGKKPAAVANHIAEAQKIPKAEVLTGAGPNTASMSWDHVLELFNSGRINEIPPDILKQIEQI